MGAPNYLDTDGMGVMSVKDLNRISSASLRELREPLIVKNVNRPRGVSGKKELAVLIPYDQYTDIVNLVMEASLLCKKG